MGVHKFCFNHRMDWLFPCVLMAVGLHWSFLLVLFQSTDYVLFWKKKLIIYQFIKYKRPLNGPSSAPLLQNCHSHLDHLFHAKSNSGTCCAPGYGILWKSFDCTRLPEWTLWTLGRLFYTIFTLPFVRETFMITWKALLGLEGSKIFNLFHIPFLAVSWATQQIPSSSLYILEALAGWLPLLWIDFLPAAFSEFHIWSNETVQGNGLCRKILSRLAHVFAGLILHWWMSFCSEACLLLCYHLKFSVLSGPFSASKLVFLEVFSDFHYI